MNFFFKSLNWNWRFFQILVEKWEPAATCPHPTPKKNKKTKCNEKVENHKLAMPLLSGTWELKFHTTCCTFCKHDELQTTCFNIFSVQEKKNSKIFSMSEWFQIQLGEKLQKLVCMVENSWITIFLNITFLTPTTNSWGQRRGLG